MRKDPAIGRTVGGRRVAYIPRGSARLSADRLFLWLSRYLVLFNLSIFWWLVLVAGWTQIEWLRWLRTTHHQSSVMSCDVTCDLSRKANSSRVSDIVSHASLIAVLFKSRGYICSFVFFCSRMIAETNAKISHFW